MPAFPRSTMLLAACATTVSAALAGCANSDDKPAEPAAGDPPATEAPTTPATSPATSAPPATPTPAKLTDRLLATDEVPGLNAKWHWQDGETGPAGAGPFGVCAKGSLSDIGATEVVARSFFPPDDSDDNAAQEIAELPDAKTTTLTWSVLKAWHDRCGTKAGAITTVATSADQALWYLVKWTPAGEEVGRFEAVGLVREGTRISVLTMDNSGQDYDYPVGQEPMVAMVKAAAAKLG